MFIGCRSGPDSEGALQLQRNVAGASMKRLLVVIVTTSVFSISISMSIHSHDARYSNQASSLIAGRLGEECFVDSDRTRAGHEEPLITEAGPLQAGSSKYDVEAFYYVRFAKSPHDPLRLRKAQHSEV